MTNICQRPIPQKPVKADKANGKRRMAEVAKLPCIICGERPVEVHHVIHDRHSQKRASDMETIPLCPPHHRTGPDAIHNGKEAWREKYGPDHGYLKMVDELLGEWF